jgi:hypothetical protein
VQEVPEETCFDVCVNSQQNCIEKEYVCINFNQESKECLSWEERCKKYDTVCTEYKESCYIQKDYYDGYYKDYKILDKKLVKKNGNTYIIPIIPLRPGNSTKILIKYKLYKTVESSIYNYFNFQTLQVPVETEHVSVVVNGDEGLYLYAYGSEKIFDNFNLPILGVANYVAPRSVNILYEESYENIFNSVKYFNGYTFAKSNLRPGDYLFLKGKYSSSWITLYIFEILLFLSAIIARLILVYKWIENKDEENKKPVLQKLKEIKEFSVWRSLGFSFICVFLFMFFLIISSFVVNSYIKEFFFSLSFISLIGTLIYIKKNS